MADTLGRIRALVWDGSVRVSSHGYDELMEDDILVRDVIEGLRDARLVEQYPDYPKGPSVLVLQKDGDGRPVHAVWGIPRGVDSPAVLVTAYRPDPRRWSEDFLRRES